MGSFATTYYFKPTVIGFYNNFASHTHTNCKKSVAKTLVKRTLKCYSPWDLYNKELRRIEQILVNNDYPLKW